MKIGIIGGTCKIDKYIKKVIKKYSIENPIIVLIENDIDRITLPISKIIHYSFHYKDNEIYTSVIKDSDIIILLDNNIKIKHNFIIKFQQSI